MKLPSCNKKMKDEVKILITLYAMIWKSLNEIALMKCYCNDKHPCPSAKAFMAICEAEDYWKKSVAVNKTVNIRKK